MKSDYEQLIERTLERLEFSLDEVDADLDYEMSGGVLTLRFDNGTSMIFSRQPPTCQLWLAARSGGYHFEYDRELGDWQDTRSGAAFRPFVVDQLKQQAGIEFSWIADPHPG